MQTVVFVRACAFGEYLNPGTFDACNPCDVGTFNILPFATACAPCPEESSCGEIAPTVAAFTGRTAERSSASGSKNATDAAAAGLMTTGFLIPEDGTWHSSVFSGKAGLQSGNGGNTAH